MLFTKLALVLAIAAKASAQSGMLPMVSLDPQTAELFENRVTAWERSTGSEFATRGHLWIDDEPQSVRVAYHHGRVTTRVVDAADIGSGTEHHVIGAVFIPGQTAAQARLRMEDHASYSKVYRPDVMRSTAELLAGSEAQDKHYRVGLTLAQSTLWFDVAFNSVYDSHFKQVGPGRFETRSRSTSIREWKSAHDESKGMYPEGQDHGFLWKSHTWWHVREGNGGVDLEIHNITLTRPVPPGAGWWANRKSRETVENLMAHTRDAIRSSR